MYTLIYTEGCSPTIRTFKTMLKLQQFVGQFIIANIANKDDNYVDAIVEGTPVIVDPAIRVDSEEGFQP